MVVVVVGLVAKKLAGPGPPCLGGCPGHKPHLTRNVPGSLATRIKGEGRTNW